MTGVRMIRFYFQRLRKMKDGLLQLVCLRQGRSEIVVRLRMKWFDPNGLPEKRDCFIVGNGKRECIDE